jgi:Putative prokaryotic signal transducing protein
VAKQKDLVVAHIAQGELEANVIKSHLESEGIPVLLQYESAGRVFGLTVDGLGEIRILVPQKLAEEAKRIIKPKEINQTEE